MVVGFVVEWDLETAALVCNALPYVGPRTFHRLVEKLENDVGRIFSATAEELVGELNLSRHATASVQEWEKHINLEREFLAMEKCGCRFIPCFSPDYPTSLRTLKDAPIGFYLAGKDIATVHSVAVVGSRSCTFAGETLARNSAKQLAECGYAVVSGLAKGIDLAAHSGALAVGGHTIAVLAGAVDIIYPPENASLYWHIREQGTLLSEFPFFRKVQRQNFAIRNRIITGLSRAIVVVESPLHGGSMLSAYFARQQQRPLFAVPGRLSDPCSAGCLQLIKEGARLFSSADDIMEVLEAGTVVSEKNQLHLPLVQAQPRMEENFQGIEGKIWEHLIHLGHATADDLSVASGLSVLDCAQVLQTLRLRGAVVRELSGEFTPGHSAR